MPVSGSSVPWSRLARLRSCGVGAGTPNPSSTIPSEAGPQFDCWYSLPSNWLRIGMSRSRREPSTRPRAAAAPPVKVGKATVVAVVVGETVAVAVDVAVGDAVGLPPGGLVERGVAEIGVGDARSEATARPPRRTPSGMLGVAVGGGAA